MLITPTMAGKDKQLAKTSGSRKRSRVKGLKQSVRKTCLTAASGFYTCTHVDTHQTHIYTYFTLTHAHTKRFTHTHAHAQL